MLIYSFEKEFVGIDEKYLRIFGFPDLAALQAKHKDFVDFFVKRPGYVHNFQYVHWIDFIDCAESMEESKVMININAKSFTANIAISTIYLTQSPSSKSYLIRLNNLRQLSGDTGEEYLVDIPENEPQEDTLRETYTEPKIIPTPQETKITPKIEIQEELPQQVASIVKDEIDYDIPLEIEMETKEEEKVSENVFTPEVDDYIFNPEVASDELGLPIDLIEEFIEDFIVQAKEFKAELYDSLARGDLETIASLSHKLKGVAGNLRIENAYDRLCIINTAKETQIIKNNLENFYYIIAQLAGETPKKKSVQVDIEPAPPLPQEDIDTPLAIDFDDDDFVLDFKEEEVVTESVPPVIEEIAIEEKQSNIVVEYSKTKAANAIGLDMETFNELLDDYSQDASTLLTEMRVAVESGDIKTCREKALLLKSMSDSMHIKDVTSDLFSINNESDKNSIIIALDNLQAIVKQISK